VAHMPGQEDHLDAGARARKELEDMLARIESHFQVQPWASKPTVLCAIFDGQSSPQPL
jgi:hypothetical protein